MKITKSQQEEINFLARNFIPTEKEKIEYINETVYGQKTNGNRISENKRILDITIKMWREDIVNGIILIDELYDDAELKQFPYAIKVIDSVVKSLDFKKYKSGMGSANITAKNIIRQNIQVVNKDTNR